MASTNEFLLGKIRDDRGQLVREFAELRDIAEKLVRGYDPGEEIQDQSETVLNALDDLVEVDMKIVQRAARIAGLEDVPRVG